MMNNFFFSRYWNNNICKTIWSIQNISKDYCEIIINCGVLIFADFVVHLQRNKNSTKFNLLPVMFKTMNSRTHGSMHFVETSNKSTFTVLNIDSIYQFVHSDTLIYIHCVHLTVCKLYLLFLVWKAYTQLCCLLGQETTSWFYVYYGFKSMTSEDDTWSNEC